MNVAGELVKIAKLFMSEKDDWKAVKNDPGREYKELPSGEKEYRDKPKKQTKAPSEDEVKEVLKDEVKKKLKERGDKKDDKKEESDKKDDGNVSTGLKESIKNWPTKQKDFFKGDNEAESEERKGFGGFIKRKSSGIAKAIKHEVKEWKTAAGAVRKLINGKEVDKHDKEAIKAVAIHTALTVGALALSGGVHFPLGSLMKHMGIHFLEHSAIANLGKVVLFAADEKDISDDDALNMIINDMADAVAKAPIKDSDWIEAAKKVDTKEFSGK